MRDAKPRETVIHGHISGFVSEAGAIRNEIRGARNEMSVWEAVLLDRKRTECVLKALKLEKIPPHSPLAVQNPLNDITMRNSSD